MRRKRRIALIILAVLLIMAVAVYLCLGMILEWAAWKAIKFVAYRLGESGIEIRDPDFEGVSMGLFPLSASVKGFSAHMALTRRNVFQIDRNFSLTIKRVTLSLGSLKKQSFTFIINSGLITFQREHGAVGKPGKEKDENDRVEVTRFEVPFQVNLLRRAAARIQVAALIEECADFVKYGVTGLPMRFKGASAFTVREKAVRGRLFLAPVEKKYRLVMDPKDFAKVAGVLGEGLTDTEFDMYCSNPLRMPRMLRIRNYASDKSREEEARDADVPAEAYKHVLWAFLLSKAYDEKFSAEVTDAHEIDAIGRSELAVRAYLREARQADISDKVIFDKKTTPEIKMDLINNMIGREYARNNYTEASVLQRTMADPRVVRTPWEVEESDLAEAVVAEKSDLREAKKTAVVKKNDAKGTVVVEKSASKGAAAAAKK